jgi:hypothetical protein
VLRAAAETDTTQGNIRDWLQLDEGDHRFQLQTEDETAVVVIVFIYFHEHHIFIMTFVMCLFLSSFVF